MLASSSQHVWVWFDVNSLKAAIHASCTQRPHGVAESTAQTTDVLYESAASAAEGSTSTAGSTAHGAGTTASWRAAGLRRWAAQRLPRSCSWAAGCAAAGCAAAEEQGAGAAGRQQWAADGWVYVLSGTASKGCLLIRIHVQSGAGSRGCLPISSDPRSSLCSWCISCCESMWCHVYGSLRVAGLSSSTCLVSLCAQV